MVLDFAAEMSMQDIDGLGRQTWITEATCNDQCIVQK